MAITVSILLIAAGAVMTWAIDFDAEGVNLSTIGVILMIVGAIGLVWALAVSSAMPWRRDTVVRDRHIHET